MRLLACDLLEPGLHGSLAALMSVGLVSIANPAVAELFASQNNPATTFAVVALGAVEIGAMVGVTLSLMRLGLGRT